MERTDRRRYDMLVFDNIRQLSKVHDMIKKRKTGTPEEFASTLCVSRRKMYYLLEGIKEMGGTVAYSRKEHTFYYLRNFDIEISVRIKDSKYSEWQEISRGGDR